jgi:hypothetical protein
MFLVTALAACGSGGGFPDARPPDGPGPTGTFSLAWSVVDQDGAPITCDEIAAQTMTVLSHNLAFDGGQTQPFTCSTGMGTSQGLTPGIYELDFELGGTFGLYARGEKQTGIQIDANANTELAPVTFEVDARGGLELKLDTGNANGNCSTGAGITQVSIALSHSSDGRCEPITLTISAGAMSPGGTYTVNCAAPVDRACIDTDQTITASNVPSDSYTIRVHGKVGGNVCWTNSDTIQVPPLQQVLMRTLNLAQLPGC